MMACIADSQLFKVPSTKDAEATIDETKTVLGQAKIVFQIKKVLFD
jgi:hypothetical protein